ncbi:hypothetical protein CDL12_21270 [Handroanthus impetiginosus]|uniref:DUF7642 domain-containing protein n=1 Tax=Handroanthus impetiginosus TaxID=429701 RepID=A0A2G9GLK6_9LAMI|nr:hypothetical protein CDL12_25165 [Handroanthus impetiginosus]PIN06187.1 hypothetical protein CDL12_21270 [Handroanthus impetiginosus]
MLMGHAEQLPNLGPAKNLLLSDPVSELDVDEEADDPLQVLYTASFDELASKNVMYDTIIWLSISLLLVLAWGVGIVMLLYLPIRRYVLQKEIESRKLYVTSNEIVYKVSRPSYIPFLGETKIKKHVPLCLIIDVIIEQGCLQSLYGLCTFRIESIAHGKAAPVDELRVQGISNPGLLRKVVVTQASKAIQDAGRSWNPNFQISGGESMFRMESLTLGPAILRSPTPSKSWKTTIGSHHQTPKEPKGVVPTDLMLHRLEEVNKSVKKIEFLIDKNQTSPGPSLDNV